jgi:hypothetical protein
MTAHFLERDRSRGAYPKFEAAEVAGTGGVFATVAPAPLSGGDFDSLPDIFSTLFLETIRISKFSFSIQYSIKCSSLKSGKQFWYLQISIFVVEFHSGSVLVL